MKVGIISDLHSLHWKHKSEIVINMIIDSVARNKPDVLIDAGDWENPFDCAIIDRSIGIPVFRIWGNHDYYSVEKPQGTNHCLFKEIDGVKFAGATLWGSIAEPTAEKAVGDYLNDFLIIPDNFTTQDYKELHEHHRKFLLDNPADVVVTHHLPTFDSVHPQYRTEQNRLNNWGFASNDDDLFDIIKPKLWVHGHTHVVMDYMKGDTRVICNPLGYPNERPISHYEPIYYTWNSVDIS